MTEPDNSGTSPTQGTWWHDRAGAIARTLIATTAGTAVAIHQRDIALGITTATSCLSLLQATCTKKPE